MRKTPKLKVCEVFTGIQGEGASIGTLSLFIRLHGCNLACPWCDSKYSWNKEPYTDYTIKGFLKEFEEDIKKVHNIVITGGEPFLQADALIKLLTALPRYKTIEIETNGTVWDDMLTGYMMGELQNVHLNISPKLYLLEANKELYDRMLLNTTVRSFNHNDGFRRPRVIIKFVIDNDNDKRRFIKYIVDYPMMKRYVYLMPEGATKVEQEEKMKDIAELAAAYGVNFSPRLHVLIWDNKRGV